MSPRARPSAYDQTIKLLARRNHFRREVEVKLGRRGYQPDEIATAIERVSGQGWLDDTETARAFVRERMSRGGYGRARLQAELQQRGVDGDAAKKVLAEETPDDDGEAALVEARRVVARSGDRDRGRLARHLERRGFSATGIASTLDALGDDEDGAADG